jgi:hypothetical protein
MHAAAAILAAAGLTAPFAPAAPHEFTAAQTGIFSAVFQNPQGNNCERAFNPQPRCNPTANAIAELADGRDLYWSGLEGINHVGNKDTLVTEFGTTAQNSLSAILDLRGRTAKFSTPKQPDSGINQDGNPDNEYLPGPLHNNDAKDNDGDLFCADLNFLADGRVITNGGTSYYQEPGIPGQPEYGIVELNGLKNTRIFDPRTNSWSEAGKMNWARWYPTMVTQPDGSIITFSGVTKMIKPYYPDRPGDSMANERHLERFDPATGQWTTLPDSAKKSLPLFPRMHLLPDGRTLFNGGGQVANPMGYSWDEATWSFDSVFDPKTNRWTDLGVNDWGGLPLGFRGSGVSVMLTIKPGDTVTKFLSVGGVPFEWPGGYFGQTATTLTSIGLGTNAFSSVSAGNLHTPRWLSDGVLLSTGQVWTVNGGDRDHLETPGIDYANKSTEMWDPATNKWTVLEPQAHRRSYHTTAVLLPDGRVLVGGHAPVGALLYGQPTDVAADNLGMAPGWADASFQIFSPPNLFWGKRPVITGVNPMVHTNKVLTVKVDRPGDISSIRLYRNPSQTHLVDGDQRNVELKIVGRTANAVQVEVPGSNYLPPGPYFLFAHTMSDSGEIPSVARQVFVDSKPPATVVQAMMTRQIALTAQELRAGVPAVPLTPDPTHQTSPTADSGRDSAVLSGTPMRSVAQRRGRRTR